MNELKSLKFLKNDISCPPESSPQRKYHTQEGKYETKTLKKLQKYYTPLKRKRKGKTGTLRKNFIRN